MFRNLYKNTGKFNSEIAAWKLRFIKIAGKCWKDEKILL